MAVQSKQLFSYNNFVHAFSGALGSLVGMVVFYPLDTVRCRLQLEDKRKAKNTLAVISDLIKEEGVWTLYRGIVPVLQSICCSNFVYFYAYHGLKNYTNNTNPGRDLVTATIAGVINVLLTTPLWMVNTRMKMTGVSVNNARYSSLLDGLIKISKAEGVGRLWRGTLPSLVLVCNPAIHMAVYEAIKRRLPGAKSAIHYFFIGALAKAVATVLTYPLQLIQTKLRHGHTHYDLAPDAGTVQLFVYIIKKQGIHGLFKGMEAKLLQTVLTAALMFMIYEKMSRTVLKVMSR